MWTYLEVQKDGVIVMEAATADKLAACSTLASRRRRRHELES